MTLKHMQVTSYSRAQLKANEVPDVVENPFSFLDSAPEENMHWQMLQDSQGSLAATAAALTSLCKSVKRICCEKFARCP